MSTNPVVPTGTKNPAELEREKSSSLAVLVEELRQSERKKYEAEMASQLAKLLQPNEDERPNIDLRAPHAYGTALRTYSPTASRYRHMSEEEREWRNPDSDHYMAEWIRGLAYRDQTRMIVAAAKLDEMFPNARADLTEGTQAASGAFSTGTGGTLLPRPLEAVVEIARDRVSKARRLVNILEMTSYTHNIPTAAAMTAAMVGESTTVAQGEPTISQVQLTAYKCQAKAIANRELLADAPINLVSLIARRAGGAIGVIEDNEVFKDGTGTKPHITKITGTSYSITTGIFRYTDAVAVFFGVPQEYLDNSVWLVASNVLQLLSNVRDGQGRPLYHGLLDAPAVTDDSPGQVGVIFNRPVYRVALTAGDLWFGDPRAQYTLGSRQGIEMRMSEHVNFHLDQVMWLVDERIAGNNVDSSASQMVTGITSCTSV